MFNPTPHLRSTFASQLQQLSVTFRRSQKTYMGQLRSQKEGVATFDIMSGAAAGAQETKEVDTVP